MNIGAYGTTKVRCGYPRELVRIQAMATKQKDWGKMGLMTVAADKKRISMKETFFNGFEHCSVYDHHTRLTR